MKDQFENLFAPDGLLSRFLYLVLFGVIFYLCNFILIALVIFQFLHLVITGEKNEKVTGFATDFSAYIGNISAYLTQASEATPFPFQDWKPTAEAAGEETAEPLQQPQRKAREPAKPRKKAAAKKTARKKTVKKKVSKRTAKK